MRVGFKPTKPVLYKLFPFREECIQSLYHLTKTLGVGLEPTRPALNSPTNFPDLPNHQLSHPSI